MGCGGLLREEAVVEMFIPSLECSFSLFCFFLVRSGGTWDVSGINRDVPDPWERLKNSHQKIVRTVWPLFMTASVVLAVQESTLRSFYLSYSIQDKEATVTVWLWRFRSRRLAP